MLVQTSIAAATSVLGYDLLAGNPFQQAAHPRRIVAIGLKGSAAALDTKIDVMVGPLKVAELYNSGTGAPNRDDLFRIGALVPATQELHAYITDAPATNPINLSVDLEG